MKDGKDLYLTIDVGTTAIKVCAVTEDFAVLTCKKTEYQLQTEGKRVTMSPEKYWDFAKEGMIAITEEYGGERIKGIAITTQGETLIPVNAEGIPLYDAVVWLDGRAGGQAARIRQLAGQEEFYQKTGIPECNELCPISKLLWFMEKEPGIYAETKYFLLLEDYLIWRLAGRMVTEKSLLSTTGYFDIMTDSLWEDILCRLGLDPGKIPPALDCGEVAGEIRRDVAVLLGLPEGTPVVTGAMDQVCGALGAGNCIPGMLTETTGTALCIGKTIAKAPVSPQYPIPVYRHYRSDLQLLLPVCMTAGMALKWFKDTFCETEAAEAERTGRDVYDLLNELAEASRPMAGGLILLPYLAGSLQPHQAPEFRGGFLGVGLDSRKCDFVRALMEGVSFMLRENLELLEQLGNAGGDLRASVDGVVGSDLLISMGGGSKSDIWCQIKADVTGCTVRTLMVSETASVGAAMLCAKGLGRRNTFDGMAKGENVRKTYHPQEEIRKTYQAGYQKYCWYLDRIIGEN